ncbi:ROK family protein [Aureibacillus halotolerans]|uniref:Glucokinase n=1 Tax=Aureibacillus halotolerans TaxID=1508390 RepID=A0A4R6UB53_9BACI|nr:ROK family protein [Aureibacillus halotolerans]TDQ42159.1 glucokinase [Aureibacillus halotolerans]
MKVAAGIDIGGTKTAIGLVNENGVLIGKKVIPTDLSLPPYEMIDRMAEELKLLLQQCSITEDGCAGIGIGAPGPLNSKEGSVTSPPNLPSWKGIQVTKQLEKHFSIPISLENDASAATLAEKWVGAAQDANDFIYMTISTGIGAGIFANGQLITGKSGNAGDIGHMVIDPAYGAREGELEGGFEYIASGTGIARHASKLTGETLTAADVFERARQGDAQLQAFVDTIFEKIGVGCVSLINTLDPEKIVIGGGVTRVGAPLFDAVQAFVNERALGPSGRETTIVPSGLDQDAGVIGAAAIVFLN